MIIEPTPELAKCMEAIKPIVEGELRQWDLLDKYTLEDNDYLSACSFATAMLAVETIDVAHPLYHRLEAPLAISAIFINKLRASGEYNQTTSGDFQVTKEDVKLAGISISKVKSYTGEVIDKGDYSISKPSVLGMLSDKYIKMYKNLLNKLKEPSSIGRVINYENKF